MNKISIPPCYKYIAKGLSSPSDRYTFSKYFFEKLSSLGADSTEIIMLYNSLTMPDLVGNIYSYDDLIMSPEEYYTSMLKLTEIADISCPQYYKSRVKVSNQNNLCHLCELSKSCKITRYEIECSLMKYVVSSRENLEQFEAFGVKNVFKSVYDIAAEIGFDVPAIVPLFNIAYSIIRSQPDDVFGTADIRTRLEALVGRITVEATKNPNVRNVQMHNHKALPVAWELAVTNIMDAKDLNYDEICAAVSKIDLACKNKRSSKKKQPLVQENPLLNLLNGPSSDIITAVDTASGPEKRDLGSSDSNNHDEAAPIPQTDEYNEAIEQSQEMQAQETGKTLKYTVPPISEDSLIFNITINRTTFKRYASPYKNNEKEIFNILQKSRRLPLEIIYDEKGSAYIFMFIRALGEFFYCLIDHNIPNSLVAILQSKSVIKICYQPYFLYSLLRLYSVRASGVYSICTMDNILHPEAQIAYYNDYFKVFAGDFGYLSPVNTGFLEFDELLLDLQKYILIHARQTRSNFNKFEYSKRHSQDEVLGSSFLRIINLRSNDYLFSLNADGSIAFNQSFNLMARHDGFFVTYSVGAEDIDSNTLHELYLDALYELSSKGRFRKYNIQLITMTEATLVLFIGEAEYELITTALQKFFNRYALINHLEKFELTAAHQRVFVKSKRLAKHYQTPHNYEQALDLLVTTNDSISVNEDHVVKRNKKKRSPQPKTFNPI